MLRSETEDLLDLRAKVYGEPVGFHVRIAQMWSAIVDHEIQPTDVALMMTSLKLLRAQATPDFSDSIDDAEGYLGIFRQIVGPDMVQASTFDEYASKKAHPARGVDCGFRLGLCSGCTRCAVNS